MNSRRIIAVFLSLVVLIGIGIGIFLSIQQTQVEEITGLIGSEKEAFFNDPRVIAELRSNGLIVNVEKAGSRQIGTSVDFDYNEYDFGFPAGIPASQSVQEKCRAEGITCRRYNTFSTPMVFASWDPIAEIFVVNDIAREDNGQYFLDMEAFLSVVDSGTTWTELEGSDVYPANTRILAKSTDVRKSNSAAMYLSLMSYVANGNNIVTTINQVETIDPTMNDIFLSQGLPPESSAVPFANYLSRGPGHSPLVMIYEAQFIEQSALDNGSVTPEMVLLYPEPTIFTQHVLVSFSEGGELLGDLLENDPELQRLAVEYGLRSGDTVYFREYMGTLGLNLPDVLFNVIEPPSFEIVEEMICRLEEDYNTLSDACRLRIGR